MRQDAMVSARCIMALCGASEPDDPTEAARVFVGALIIGDLARDLMVIRKFLGSVGDGR